MKRGSAKAVSKKVIFTNLNDKYLNQSRGNSSIMDQSSMLPARSTTPLKTNQYEFRGQNRIHFDYEVGSPNINQEIVVPKRMD